MKKILLLIATLYVASATLYAQENVSNIRVVQQDSLLYVTYDLEKESNIELHYSSSNGVNYFGPLKKLTGDYGSNVAPGADKEIVWDAVPEIGYIDAPESVIKIVSEVIPEPEPEPEPESVAKKDWGKHNLLMVGVSLTNGEVADMPISLMYGHYRHFGWYIKVESNIPTHECNYAYSDVSTEQLSFSDDYRFAYTALKSGFLWNINNKFIINLGVGVQVETFSIATEDTSSGDDIAVAIDPPINSNGFPTILNSVSDNVYFVGEIGATYNWRKLSVGVNVTPNINRFVGYEGMGAEEYSQSYRGGEYDDYHTWATPIYKTKLIASVLLGINF